MTKREMIQANKQAANERLHATTEWQEAERLIEEMERLNEAGQNAEARKLYTKIQKLHKEARTKMTRA